MKRRVGSDDFKSATPFEMEELSGFFYWEHYEYVDIAEEDGRLPYFRASLDRGVRYYRPLFDTPYLFLEFARIAEHKDQPDKALDTWASKYGLLGLTKQDPELSLGPIPEGRWTSHAAWFPEVSEPPLKYTASGGPGDTLHAYFYEAAKANKLLTLYEALLSQDCEKLEQCFAFHERCTPEEFRGKWRSQLEENNEKNADLSESSYMVKEVLDDMLIYKSLPGDWNTFLMDWALHDIWEMVGRALSVFAFPSITAQGGSGPLSPGKLTSTLRVRNLLGAMYLQFYWLITSTGALSRCKYCNRNISYAPPMPENEGRKPRKDKEFCDSRCRQNYHYHNRIKPNRNSE